MANVQIIGAPQSNYVWVVRMACEEKGVPYDLVPARPHSPEVDALHPLGKIPGMRHGEVALCESKAIATYIDRSFGGPKLIPEDARGAAEVEKWVSLVNTSVDPCMVRTYLLNHVFPKGADGQPDRAAIDGVLPNMQKQIDLLDKAVAATGHLAGSGYTLADINLMPPFGRTALRRSNATRAKSLFPVNPRKHLVELNFSCPAAKTHGGIGRDGADFG